MENNAANEREVVNQIVENMTLFDDDLMSMVFDKNITATELILKIILGREDIHVISVVGQREMKNPIVEGRCIRLDILVEDSEKKRYNVEVQRDSKGADVRSARFHSSMLDVRMLKEGQGFEKLKDSYVIFITEKDYFGEGYPVYTLNRQIKENGKDAFDGSHIIYVNGSYKGNDAIGKLMHDFKCKNPEDMEYPELAYSVKHFKKEGGKNNMSEAVEKYAEMRAKKAAKEAAKKEKEVTIRTVIEISIECGLNKEKVIENLCKKCSLSRDEAEEQYEIYA